MKAKIIIKAAAVILAVTATAVMASCSRNTGKSDATSHQTTERRTDSGSVTTQKPQSTFDGVTATSHFVSDEYKEGDTQLILNLINCPVFSGDPKYNFEKINSTLEEYCLNYAKITSSDREVAKEDFNFSEGDFESYQKSADYTYYVWNGILSVKYDCSESSGGAGDVWKTTALCFDLTSGERLDLAAFLSKDADYAKQYVVSAFSMLILSSPEEFYDNANELLPHLDYRYLFYLSETGLVLFVDSGVICPDAYGEQTVTVAYENLPA